MCGIVGMINGKSVAPSLVSGLRNLEYRGYDSAGIAICDAGELSVRRASGSIDVLAATLADDPIDGPAGIGHTRWATHGAPTARNAHPHRVGGIAVVHNGIIENYKNLRAGLEADGVRFTSDTDSEVIPHILASFGADGLRPLDAVRETAAMLEGQFAFAALFHEDPRTLYAARCESPLVIGSGPKEVMVASDMMAFGAMANQTLMLDSGEVARVRRDGVTIVDASGAALSRPWREARHHQVVVDKAGHDHFMRKEILEQPDAVARTLKASASDTIARPVAATMRDADRLTLIACGTSYYAGMAARDWFERFTDLSVDLDIASEFRYRNRRARAGDRGLFISQSGETADTLACLQDMKQAGARTAAIVNVPTSSMAREADTVVPTLAGPEIGVASTKAFTAQLAALLGLARTIGGARGTLDAATASAIRDLDYDLPRLMREALGCEDACRDVAKAIQFSSSVLFLGRGANHAMAMEGALKLKEISYIHAEGFAAGELKHGPIALIDDSVPVVVIAPRDDRFAKTASNVEEVAARGGMVILLSDREGCAQLSGSTWKSIELPETDALTTPFVYAIALQFLAYHTTLALGHNVDRPRNLAKSVTVE